MRYRNWLAAAALATLPAAAGAQTTAQASDAAVTYLPADQVKTAFAKGVPMVEVGDYKIHASRREAPGMAEIHTRDTDIAYILQGSATLVTGGTAVGVKAIGPEELRGTAIEGGSTRQLEVATSSSSRTVPRTGSRACGALALLRREGAPGRPRDGIGGHVSRRALAPLAAGIMAATLRAHRRRAGPGTGHGRSSGRASLGGHRPADNGRGGAGGGAVALQRREGRRGGPSRARAGSPCRPARPTAPTTSPRTPARRISTTPAGRPIPPEGLEARRGTVGSRSTGIAPRSRCPRRWPASTSPARPWSSSWWWTTTRRSGLTGSSRSCSARPAASS